MKELKNEYVDQLFDKSLNALYAKFNKYVSQEELLKISEHAYEIIRVYKADKCLVNLKNLPVHDSKSAEYINNVWFPRVKKLGVQVVAIVLPDSALGKLSSKNAHKNAEVINGVVVNNFSSESEARKWLTQANSTSVTSKLF
jgi:hypothetical protein